MLIHGIHYTPLGSLVVHTDIGPSSWLPLSSSLTFSLPLTGLLFVSCDSEPRKLSISVFACGVVQCGAVDICTGCVSALRQYTNKLRSFWTNWRKPFHLFHELLNRLASKV